jgi:hypothetical protein
VFLFVLSPLVWFFLWLPEEVLTLLFLLHCEDEDFSIIMKDIYLSVISSRRGELSLQPSSKFGPFRANLSSRGSFENMMGSGAAARGENLSHLEMLHVRVLTHNLPF